MVVWNHHTSRETVYSASITVFSPCLQKNFCPTLKWPSLRHLYQWQTVCLGRKHTFISRWFRFSISWNSEFHNMKFTVIYSNIFCVQSFWTKIDRWTLFSEQTRALQSQRAHTHTRTSTLMLISRRLNWLDTNESSPSLRHQQCSLL